MPTIDTVQAIKTTPHTVTSQGIKESAPARFSTVLVQDSPRNMKRDGPLSGLRVAQV
ncbi:hypothetical protein BYT27DRAFT_7251569 [Phlegmacium glaucopus]|nr:hypothetical protein BYT27DRAFT_7251569 [Phlegmacium glaucopus]